LRIPARQLQQEIGHRFSFSCRRWRRSTSRIAQEAAARYNAVVKRDANTVSEQELAAAAKDALTAAAYNRLQGGEQNLALAAKSEQAARTVSVGKEAYVKQMAAQAVALNVAPAVRP
jgi:hypothetical protein